MEQNFVNVIFIINMDFLSDLYTRFPESFENFCRSVSLYFFIFVISGYAFSERGAETVSCGGLVKNFLFAGNAEGAGVFY